MRAAPAEDVDIELVRLCQQEVRLAANKGETFEKADAEGAVGDDLREWQGGGIDVEAALGDLEIWGDGA